MSNVKRFGFGANWLKFQRAVGPEQIAAAQQSLGEMFSNTSFSGRTFLDAGCGSGLFSVAASRLGAMVTCFDFDEQSVQSTRELCSRTLGTEAPAPVRGDLVDRHWMRGLGRFDFVYCWGVAHHTGSMWKAIENACGAVDEQGQLCLAIYNRQAVMTPIWKAVKALYTVVPRPLKWILASSYFLPMLAVDRVRVFFAKPGHRAAARGMSLWHDAVDWVGGYPFEAATPEQITAFCADQGLVLLSSKTTRGHGCNEFLFARTAKPPAANQQGDTR